MTKPEEVEERLNDYFARDIDLVKVIYENGLGVSNAFPRIDPELLTLVAERCREGGVPLMIHAMDLEEYREAVVAKPRAIVHMLEEALPENDPLPRDIASADIFVTPTLVLFEAFYRFIDEPELWEDSIVQASVPDFVAETLRSEATLERAVAGMDGFLKTDSAFCIIRSL